VEKNNTIGLDLDDILSLTAKKENVVEAVQGIVKFTKEFWILLMLQMLLHKVIAREALKR
jgi:hypothetical protein